MVLRFSSPAGGAWGGGKQVAGLREGETTALRVLFVKVAAADAGLRQFPPNNKG